MKHKSHCKCFTLGSLDQFIHSFFGFTADSTRELHHFYRDQSGLDQYLALCTKTLTEQRNIFRLSVNLFEQIILPDLKKKKISYLGIGGPGKTSEKPQSPQSQLKLISPCFTLTLECITRTDCHCQTEALYRWNGGGTGAVGMPGTQKAEMGLFPRSLNCSVICPAWFKHAWRFYLYSAKAAQWIHLKNTDSSFREASQKWNTWHLKQTN